MIPRHRPPFGIASLLASAVRMVQQRSELQQLEQAWAGYLKVPHAIWLPSARYGIAVAIDQHVPADGRIFASAFNCGAVHHALSVTGRDVCWQDCEPDSFLADCRSTSAFSADAASGQHGIVLSEMFGQRFSADALNQPIVHQARIRVFDMAMCLPTPTDVARLRSTDVAVCSFGLGKSLFAGAGGLAITWCDRTAQEIRRRRTLDLQPASAARRLRWDANLLVRTVAHAWPLYAVVRRRRNEGNGTRAVFSRRSHEWTRPATRWQVARSLDNLANINNWIGRRTTLAAAYRQSLKSCGADLRLPNTDHGGLSHFSIRVAASVRNDVCAALANSGVDVGRLFPLAAQFDAGRFPEAARAAQEVINLPLSNQLTMKSVADIAAQTEIAVRRSTQVTTAPAASGGADRPSNASCDPHVRAA